MRKLVKSRASVLIWVSAWLTCWGCGGSTQQVRTKPDGTGQPQARPMSEQTQQAFAEAVSSYREGKAAGKVDYARVEGQLRQVLELDPHAVRAQYDLGVLYEEQGRIKEAEGAYLRTLELDPKYVNALSNLGQIYLKRGNRDVAVNTFQKVLELDAFNAFARNNLAALHRQNAIQQREAGDKAGAEKSIVEAVENVRKVLAADPENLLAYNNLVLIYHDLGKYELAMLVAVSAQKFNKPDAALRNNLGLVLLKMNKVTNATSEFREALKIDPNFAAASINLGAISLNYRDFAGAYEQFSAAVKSDASDPDLILSLGVAARGLGKFDEAEKWYKKVLQLEPDAPDAWFNLGVLYQEHWNKPGEALEAFRNFLRVAPAVAAADKTRIEDVRGRVDGLVQLMKIMDEQEKLKREAPKGPPDEEEDEGAEPASSPGSSEPEAPAAGTEQPAKTPEGSAEEAPPASGVEAPAEESLEE